MSPDPTFTRARLAWRSVAPLATDGGATARLRRGLAQLPLRRPDGYPCTAGEALRRLKDNGWR